MIRPHAWGRYEDLLRATAESPAMLFYLDTWLSADPDARPAPPIRTRGLNENYAREIRELYTLGVDGGCPQRDVTELARVFTGWTIRGLAGQRPEFLFDERIHDPGDKVVMGHVVTGAAKAEGDRMIHLLATHPSTARFVSLKLCRRFHGMPACPW